MRGKEEEKERMLVLNKTEGMKMEVKETKPGDTDVESKVLTLAQRKKRFGYGNGDLAGNNCEETGQGLYKKTRNWWSD